MSKEYFITISKYNRGSLEKEEIQEVVKLLQTPFFKYDEILIVNEHQNKKQEDYEHLHIYLNLKEPRSNDVLRRKLKENLSFYSHTKDMVIEKVVDKDTLIGGYFMKTGTFDIVFMDGITEQDMKTYKEKVEVKRETFTQIKSVKVTRIYKGDIPYMMKKYIEENNLDYNCSHYYFREIIKAMIKDGYDFELSKKLFEVKAKLDLLFGKDDLMNQLIDDELIRFSSYEEIEKVNLYKQKILNKI